MADDFGLGYALGSDSGGGNNGGNGMFNGDAFWGIILLALLFGNNGFGGGFGGFGGGSSARANSPRKGENARVNITISFEEAAFGVTKEITIPRIEDCEECSGTGAAKGTHPETCSECGGSGTVRTQQRTPFGVMSSTSQCPRCGGTGKIIKTPCSVCQGKGKVKKTRKISVNIPAGIDHGQTISLRGQGHAGINGGPKGDLLITVSVKAHPLFERDGSNVLFEMPISFVQATLGAEVEVPTLDGKVKYTIPEGTQSGTIFRLKGKGIPYLSGNARGDQYVTVYIVTPKNLSKEQKELLRQFGEATGEAEGVKSSGGIFEKKKKKK